MLSFWLSYLPRVNVFKHVRKLISDCGFSGVYFYWDKSRVHEKLRRLLICKTRRVCLLLLHSSEFKKNASNVSVHSAPEKLDNTVITRHFVFVFGNVSGREIASDYSNVSVFNELRFKMYCLYGRDFICNRIGFDAVTPFVYTAPVEFVIRTGSFWNCIPKWSVFKTMIRFHWSRKRRNRIDIKPVWREIGC